MSALAADAILAAVSGARYAATEVARELPTCLSLAATLSPCPTYVTDDNPAEANVTPRTANRQR